jgi:dienelactone hydrolase
LKAVYTLNEDGFSAYWFEGSKHKEKAIVWMHGSAMNEKHCLADSLYLREAGYSVLVLGFYYWKGMSKKMRAIPVEYVEKAVSELKKNGYEKIGIHGISSGAAYALL